MVKNPSTATCYLHEYGRHNHKVSHHNFSLEVLCASCTYIIRNMYVIRIFPIVPYIYIIILVIHGKVIHTSNSFNFTEPPESILVLHPHQSNETSNLGEDRWWPKIQSHQHVNTLSVRNSSNLGHTYQDLHVLQPPKWLQVSASWNPNLWVFASAGQAFPVSKADPQMTHLDAGRRLGHPNVLHHLDELELWKDPKRTIRFSSSTKYAPSIFRLPLPDPDPANSDAKHTVFLALERFGCLQINAAATVETRAADLSFLPPIPSRLPVASAKAACNAGAELQGVDTVAVTKAGQNMLSQKGTMTDEKSNLSFRRALTTYAQR